MRVIREWLQKTWISLNTWLQAAASFVGSDAKNGKTEAQLVVVALSRSASDARRATNHRQTILQLPLLEATMRAKLLNNVLPATQRNATTILDLLLFIIFQTFSESCYASLAPESMD